ncbi:DUF4326 domain-containing protein [Ottowia sp.]|uniref:DUF4326 domain-containing protein n=1 Tax=Ottowia sp. TaxID=1898956 RepID=UPI0025EE238E|nr:DUF4326 domain-containing protein [Ottowia sp.]MBK6616608.1 DUF4326 domain-containing protein [Ottowia sp.]
MSKRKGKGAVTADLDELVIDIDFSSGSVLGNRHRLSNYRDDDERSLRIAEFARDLDEDCERRGPMHAEIERIAALVKSGSRVALQCWCKPRACHGDGIAVRVAALAGVEVATPATLKGVQECQQFSFF